MSALRDQILNAADIQEETVTISAWNGAQILVRGMTGNERARFLEEAFDLETGKPKFDRMHAEVIIACCYDPADGSRLFGPADRDALNGKAAHATETLAKAALRLSGLDEEAEEGKDGGSSTANGGRTSLSPSA